MEKGMNPKVYDSKIVASACKSYLNARENMLRLGRQNLIRDARIKLMNQNIFLSDTEIEKKLKQGSVFTDWFMIEIQGIEVKTKIEEILVRCQHPTEKTIILSNTEKTLLEGFKNAEVVLC